MPELPEIETIRRGLAPHIKNAVVTDIVVRNSDLRWPVNLDFKNHFRICNVGRRGKYLLLYCDTGTIIVHLGMTGSLQLLKQGSPYRLHDHVDIVLDNGKCLRFNDPRKFGAILWTEDDPLQHKLLVNLGPEPLTDSFNGAYLYNIGQNKKRAIKLFIMDGHVVAGVGNIYANEALFAAGLHPQIPAGEISLTAYKNLVQCIKNVLLRAINAGGTTFRDYINSDGKPGYFKQELMVYGRGGKPCKKCNTILNEIMLGQRNTVFCPKCQCLNSDSNSGFLLL